jgi:hypothetical protein
VLAADGTVNRGREVVLSGGALPEARFIEVS